MVKRYLEDLEIGEKWTSPSFSVSEQDIIEFGQRYDPQPMHIDPQAAQHGPFGSLVASGWQMAALAMRMCVQARSYGDLPVVGIGLEELRWLRPVRPGDVLTVQRELVDILPMPDNPKRGTAKARVELRNQQGEVVMRMVGLTSVPKRPAA